MLGWWSLVGAGGPVLGVALGGPLIQAFGWRWIFVIQAPLIAIALLVNSIVLRETEPTRGAAPRRRRRRAPRARRRQPAVRAQQEHRLGMGESRCADQPGALPLGAARLRAGRARAVDPLLPLEWLRRRNFALPCAANLCANFAYLGGFFLTPLLLERGFGYSVSHAGYLQIARPLTFAIAAPVAGYLAVRTGERAASVSGLAMIVLSMLVFASLTRAGQRPRRRGRRWRCRAWAWASPRRRCRPAWPTRSSCRRMGTASAAMQMTGQVGQVAGIQIMETVQVARQHERRRGRFVQLGLRGGRHRRRRRCGGGRLHPTVGAPRRPRSCRSSPWSADPPVGDTGGHGSS